MTKDTLQKTLSIVSNLGVILGIVLLVVEIRETNKQAALASVQETLLSSNEASQIMAESEILPSIYLKLQIDGLEALTPEESLRVRAWENSRIRRNALQYYQYQNGYLEQELYDQLVVSIKRNLPLWKELGTNVVVPEFYEMENL